MTPEAVLADLVESGITPSVTPDGKGLAVPIGALTPAQRAAVVACKRELIAYLVESSRMTSALIDAAMAVCDAYGDGDQARAAMRADIEATPAHLRADLLQHLKRDARRAAANIKWKTKQ